MQRPRSTVELWPRHGHDRDGITAGHPHFQLTLLQIRDDLVVVGGGVAKAGALLFDPLRDALTTYLGLDFIRGLQVKPAELGGDAGLVGAAALVATPADGEADSGDALPS